VTALQLAVWFNPNTAVIRTLLQAGADPLRSDGNGGHTLLYLLVGRPDAEPDVVRRVLDAGVPAPARIIGRSVVSHAAAHVANPGVIRALIEAGADPNAPDWTDGSTPLFAAATRNPDPEIIEVLREAGARMAIRVSSLPA
jgi:ankyrin repeat protein